MQDLLQELCLHPGYKTRIPLRDILDHCLLEKKLQPALLKDLQQLKTMSTMLPPSLQNIYVKSFLDSMVNLFEKSATLSLENSFEAFEITQMVSAGGSAILFPKSDIKMLLNWWNKLKNIDDPTVSSTSSGTQKDSQQRSMMPTGTKRARVQTPQTGTKKNMDTSTSITPVPTGTAIVSADSYEDGTLSEDSEDDRYMDINLQPMRPLNGCATTSKHRDNIYSWTSARYPPWNTFVKLEIYQDTRALRKTEPKNRWRLATFRSALLLGNTMEPDKDAAILQVVKNLKGLMIDKSREFPGVVSNRREISKDA